MHINTFPRFSRNSEFCVFRINISALLILVGKQWTNDYLDEKQYVNDIIDKNHI